MIDFTKLTGPVKAFVELLKSGFGMSDAQIEAIGEHNLTEQARLVAGELHKAAAIVTETGEPAPAVGTAATHQITNTTPGTPDTIVATNATEVKVEGGAAAAADKPMGVANGANDGEVPVGIAAVPVRDLLKATEVSVLAKLDEVLTLFNALEPRLKALEDATPTYATVEATTAHKAEVDLALQKLGVGIGEAKRAADAYAQLTQALPTILGARGAVKGSPAMDAAVENIQNQINDTEQVFTGAFRMRPQIGNN